MRLELEQQSKIIQNLKPGDVVILDERRFPYMVIAVPDGYKLLNLKTYMTATAAYKSIEELMNFVCEKPIEIISSDSLVLKRI